MRIALATAAHLPRLSEDDHILHQHMLSRGLDAEPVIWDGDTRWSDYDVVVIRSIWDYHLKYERFLRWLADLDASGARSYNPTALARWNADKRYLLDLEQQGVRITPTRVVDRWSETSLAALACATGWDRIVVKPTVASTGWETWQLDTPVDADSEARFREQVGKMSVLVQEFIPGVRHGERSFVFIGGEYSHTVLKQAAGAEFRVHIEHGGTVERIEPSGTQIDWARSVAAAIRHPWMYARVDAVQADDGLRLMELEMLEPELFFAYDADACRRFTDQILK